MDAAAEALGSGAPGADDAYATALDRWLALGGADLDERAGSRRGRRRRSASALDMPMTALSGGQAARAGLAALLLSPLRRAAARRAHERPRPRRAGAPRAVRHRPALAGRHRQPRPGVPRPHGEPDRRAGPRAAAGRGLRAAATTATSPSARSRAGTRGRRTRSTTTSAGRSRTAPSCSATGWRRASATHGARRPTRTSIVKAFRQQTSEKQAAKARQTERRDRAAGGRRGAAQGVGAADDDRRGTPLGDGRGVAARRGGAARDVHARAGRRPGRLGGPGRDHRGERVGQVDAAGRAARAHPAGRGQRRAGLVACGSARSTRRAGCSSGPSRWSRAFRDAVPDWSDARRPHAAGEVRADAASTCRGRRPRCRRASGRGRRWRCCRRAR